MVLVRHTARGAVSLLLAEFLCCCAIATVSAQYGSSRSWKVDVGSKVDAALKSSQIGISASGQQVNGAGSGPHPAAGNDMCLRTCASLLLALLVLALLAFHFQHRPLTGNQSQDQGRVNVLFSDWKNAQSRSYGSPEAVSKQARVSHPFLYAWGVGL